MINGDPSRRAKPGLEVGVYLRRHRIDDVRGLGNANQVFGLRNRKRKVLGGPLELVGYAVIQRDDLADSYSENTGLIRDCELCE